MKFLSKGPIKLGDGDSIFARICRFLKLAPWKLNMLDQMDASLTISVQSENPFYMNLVNLSSMDIMRMAMSNILPNITYNKGFMYVYGGSKIHTW